MLVEWDDKKAASNVRKHGIAFEEAVTALMDPAAVTFVDDSSGDESLEITVGHSILQKLLLVVHVERERNVIRIISARRATRKERKAYEEGI